MSFTDVIKKSVLEGFHVGDLSTVTLVVTLGMAVAMGLFEGRDNGQLDPRATATRAEMITVINQFIDKYEG